MTQLSSALPSRWHDIDGINAREWQGWRQMAAIQESIATIDHSIASIDQAKNTAIDLAIRFGPRLLVAILILCVGVLVSRWVARWVGRGLNRIELEPPVRQLL